jgi:hypothetical protein
MNRARWGHNHAWSEHWTEADPRVLDFLRETFKADPDHRQRGADFLVGPYLVEVKSCQEWVKWPNNGGRRRGRFRFYGHEAADFILFVLVKGEELEMRLVKGHTVEIPEKGSQLNVPWPTIFKEEAVA